MLKFSGFINKNSTDTKIVEDYACRKGYQDKVIEHQMKENGEFEEVEIDNPESIDDYFDRILSEHVEAVVQGYRDKNVANKHKADKVKL